jgi:hypothetical protein
MDTNLRFEYQITYANFLDAQRLYRRRRWTQAVVWGIFCCILPIVGVLVSLPLLAFIVLGDESSLVDSSRSLAPLGFLFVVIWLVTMFSYRTYWKKLLPESVIKRSTKTTITVALELTAEQLISILPNRSEGRFMWSALPDFVEDKKIALIFIKKKQFIFIPKDAITEDAWAFIRSHIIPRK